MKRACLSYIDWLSQPGVTFTTDNEVADAPASNLALPAAGEPWRAVNLSLSSGAVEVEIDLGADRPGTQIGVFAFLLPDRRDDSRSVDYMTEIAATDTVQWLATTDGGTEGDAYDSGAVASGVLHNIGMHCHIPPAGAITDDVRTITLKIVAASRTVYPDDFITIGRAWCGPLFRFYRNFDPKFGQRWIRDGLGHRVRELNLSFERLKSSLGEREEMLRMQQYVADRNQVLFCHSEDLPAEALIGTLNTLDFVTGQFFNNSRMPLQITEDFIGV